MNSKEYCAMGELIAGGYKRGVEWAQNATEEERVKFFEELSQNRSHYEMQIAMLRRTGMDESEIVSFEQWSESVRDIPANIKRVNEWAKQALKDMGVSG